MQTQDKNKAKTAGQVEHREEPIATPNWPEGIVISKKENMTVSVADDLTVVLSENAFEQLFGWAYSTSREISCLGCVTRENNSFIIERFYLVKQSCSSMSTELDPAAVAELIEKLMAEGKTNEARSIKCWAHSHPDMDTFWSQTDNATCRLLVSDFLVSVVVSNNFAARARIDIAGPVAMTLDNVPVIYRMKRDALSVNKYSQEVQEAVQAKQIFLAGQTGAAKDVSQQPVCSYCGCLHEEKNCPFINQAALSGDSDEEFMF